MFVDLEPGSKSAPRAKNGFTIPISNTLPDINPDEIFGALDADTRDYLRLLVDGAGRGLDKQGGNLRELLRRFEPTHRDLAAFTTKVSERRRNLRRLIHNLNVLNTELAGKDTELSQLVSSSSQVFHAFAVEQSNITKSVDLLPTTARRSVEAASPTPRCSGRRPRPSRPSAPRSTGPTTSRSRWARRARPSWPTRSGRSCATRGRWCAISSRPPPTSPPPHPI